MRDYRGPRRLSLVAAVVAAFGFPALADPAPARSFAQITDGLKLLPGLAPVYLDDTAGKVLMAFAPEAEGGCGQYLYQVYMRSGLGSTPVGIDRSNPGATRILVFRRAGPKVVAELENTLFRAEGGSAAEAASVRESFPPSIVWAGDIQAVGPGGILLVDVTSFLGRDAFGVAGALKDAKQGDFELNPDRGYVDVEGVQAFPDNLEFEAHETFVSKGSEASLGSEVKAILPDAHAITLIEHQSLIRLPAPGYVPRPADPRTGAFNQLVTDYAAPLGSPIVYRLAERFRLEKTNPAAARSPVKKPIVFYVDPAAPEPVRDALLEGARWWTQAFDAAGFIDAFKVAVLPAGVSPLDARYSVINWVHRQTRGWSYGFPVVDPRTGEIVKGAVLLGSLRARQDRMIFEGLVGADATGTGAPDDPIVVSLARLRQLAVHETGHALGLEHNFAGSTYGDRASVMDYPPPRIGIKDGKLSFRDAYKVGLGDWDRFAIHWLYAELVPGVEGRKALDRIVEDGYADGLRYVRDDDARPTGSSHPAGGLWDDGPDAIAGLAHALAVRKIALDRFGPTSVPVGAPLSDLRRVIVPIYLFHRYEVDAVAKSVGGVDFAYGLRGAGAPDSKPVDGAEQRRALAALLATLDPALLDLPNRLIDQLSAGRDGAADPQYTTELFSKPVTPVFDIAAAARAAADITLGDLLDPSRLERLQDQGSRLDGALGLVELLDRTVDTVFSSAPLPPRRARLRRVVQERLIVHLGRLVVGDSVSAGLAPQVRAALDRLGERLATARSKDGDERAQARYFSRLILNRTRDELAALVEADRPRAPPPPGMPIGAGEGEDCWFCEVVDAEG